MDTMLRAKTVTASDILVFRLIPGTTRPRVTYNISKIPLFPKTERYPRALSRVFKVAGQ